METMSKTARWAAALIAIIGVTGLMVRFGATYADKGNIGATLWSMFRFFTIIGNLLAVVMMTGVARNATFATKPRSLGGIVLLMALIGIVYAVLLSGKETLHGAAAVSNVILHDITPVLVALFWLVFAPKGGLGWSDPPRWALLPLAYFPYALARAAQDGKYPYPFMDVSKFGWQQVLINVAAIAACFLLAGSALVWLDKRLPRPPISAG